MNQVEIFTTKDNQTEVQVLFENETVWLNQSQMAILFNSSKQNVSLHINNCFKENELDKKATVKKNLTVQTEGKRKIQREIEFYNLDVIISVGYRIKSIQGTQFRQWATQRLKDYLIKGHAINTERLKQLEQVVQIINQKTKDDELQLNEAKGLLDILGNYTQSFILLSQYDSQSLVTENVDENITYEIQYEEAVRAIEELKIIMIQKKEASELFGNQKDNSFKGVLGNIVQSFGGQYLYPSIEEQAANLLYFIIKNHPFSDGNKRIGAFMFV